jgi:tetratricopeptide (TPR) repeat protein
MPGKDTTRRWPAGRRRRLAAEQADLAAEEAWQRDARDALRRWPPRRVAAEDPFSLGVAPTELTAGFPMIESPPPYVRRAADHLARKRLRKQGTLLLVGEPASGVSRTAFEAAVDVWPHLLLVAPDPSRSDAPRHALEHLDLLDRLPRRGAVLWLDRIDRWLPDGLPAGLLRRCREEFGVRIVATISARRYAESAAMCPELFAEFGELGPVLGRLPTEQERHEAHDLYPGVDFSEGIATAFTATGFLLATLRSGYGDCPFEPSEVECPLARAVLDVAADWHRTGTPRALPRHTLADLVAARLGCVPDPAHLDAVLCWGASTGLLLRLYADGGAEEPVAASAAVAEVLDQSGAPLRRDAWDAALAAALDGGDAEATGRIAFRAHVRGERAVADAAWDSVTDADSPIVAGLSRAAEYSAARSDPRTEVPLRQRLLGLVEVAHGGDALPTSDAVMHLGVAWHALGEPAKARACHARALRIREELLDPDDPDVASALTHLGVACRDLGQPTRARACHARALRIREDRLGPDHPDVAVSLINLGAAWSALGEPAEARDHYERALRISEKRLGPEHPHVAVSLTDLGAVWSALGEPARALDCHARALRISEKRLGPDHPHVAVSLTDLGIVWSDMGEPARARACHERALRISENRLGPDHPDVAGILSNLGAAWQELGEPDEALECHQRALRIREDRLGPDHPEVASALTNLGIACAVLGNAAGARDCHQRALRIREERLDRNHPDIAVSLYNVGVGWHEVGEPARAREHFERALRTALCRLPAGHPTVQAIEQTLRHADHDRVRSPGRTVSRSVTTNAEGPVRR